eukprot:EG_transcript_20806
MRPRLALGALAALAAGAALLLLRRRHRWWGGVRRAPTLADARASLAALGLPSGPDYDPADPALQSLRRFQPVLLSKPCAVRARAVCWGSPDWDPALSLEHNVRRSLGALLHLAALSQHRVDAACAGGPRHRDPAAAREWIRRELPRHPARRQLCVDAFVLEVRGLDYHRDLPALAATLRRVLRCLCDHDPAHAQALVRCMDHPAIGDPSSHWSFTFAKEPLTPMTFAPLYPATHPRTVPAEVGGDSCFVVLQPESAFVWYDLGEWTSAIATKWEAPQTFRDWVRRRFFEAGQAYPIPPEPWPV